MVSRSPTSLSSYCLHYSGYRPPVSTLFSFRLTLGTMVDLRDDPAVLEKLAKSRQRPIAFEQGERLARELGAVKYVECSALTQKGLKNVFDEVPTFCAT